MFVQTSSNFGSTWKVYFAFVPLCFQPQQSVFDTEILILNPFLCYSIVKITIRLLTNLLKFLRCHSNGFPWFISCMCVSSCNWTNTSWMLSSLTLNWYCKRGIHGKLFASTWLAFYLYFSRMFNKENLKSTSQFAKDVYYHYLSGNTFSICMFYDGIVFYSTQV